MASPPSTSDQVPALRRALLRWYHRHHRRLPWRETRDPYRIWISEVMLQQTRVEVVRGYYQRFLRRFPDLETLARARPQAVLAAWSGLGYYRRARMLHAAARQVVRKGGRMPRTEAELALLPGIGRYTAAAVASIAFGRPAAVVDGNVERVLHRLLGWRKPRSWQQSRLAVQELLSPRSPGDFNQAMMELGATVCLPASPLCGQCPLSHWCASRGPLPAPAGKPRRKAVVACRLAWRNGSVFLVRRPLHEARMPGMWELPSAELRNGARSLLRLRHSITDTDYDVLVFSGPPPAREGRWVRLASVHRLPLTGLCRKILAELPAPDRLE